MATTYTCKSLITSYKKTFRSNENYLLDSIAVAFNTLPRYIHISKHDKAQKTVYAMFLEEELSHNEDTFEGAQSSDPVSQVTQYYADEDINKYVVHVQKYYPDVSIDEGVRLWLSRNSVMRISPILVFNAQVQFDAGFDYQSFVEYEAESFENDIMYQKKVVKANLIEIEKVVNRKLVNVDHTDIFYISNTHIIKTDIQYNTLEYIFDMFVPTDTHPVCVFNGMDKRLVSVSKYPSHVELSQIDRNSIYIFNNSGYTHIKIYYTPTTPGESKPSVGIHPLTIEVYESHGSELDVEKVCRVIGYGCPEIDGQNIISKDLNGVSYCIGYEFDMVLLRDFVMNDKHAQRVLSFVETTNTFSKFNTTRFICKIPGLQSQFRGSLSLKAFTASSGDSKYITKMLSDNDKYIRIYVRRVKNTADFERVVDAICDVFALFISSQKRVAERYSVLFPETKFFIFKEPKYTPKDSVTLHDTAPNIFMSNYTRMCMHSPEPVLDMDVSDVDPNDQSLIIFPKDVDPKVYRCAHPVYKYAGIRDNILPNADEYPEVPCCFKTEQRKKPRYVKYYSGIEVYGRANMRMIMTSKILQRGFFGILPQSIYYILKSLDVGSVYMRRGISTRKSPDNLVECVLDALGISASGTDIRKKIIENKYVLNSAMQENYDRTILDIEDDVASGKPLTVYRHVSLIENLLGVSITVIERRPDETCGIVVPHSACGYYKYRLDPSTPHVLIYLNSGQYELISKWDVTENTYVSIFRGDSEIIESLAKSSTSGITYVDMSEHTNSCVSQVLDYNGKMVGMFVRKHDSATGISDEYVEVQPSSPLAVPFEYADKSPLLNMRSTDLDRTVRSVCEMFVHLFSKYIKRKKISLKDVSSTVIEEYVQSRVVIDPSYSYEIRSSYIDENVDAFVAQSADAVERLKSYLDVCIVNKPDWVETHWARSHLETFYTTVDDYLRSVEYKVEPVGSGFIFKGIIEVYDYIPADVREGVKIFFYNENLIAGYVCVLNVTEGAVTDNMIDEHDIVGIYISYLDIKIVKNSNNTKQEINVLLVRKSLNNTKYIFSGIGYKK